MHTKKKNNFNLTKKNVLVLAFFYALFTIEPIFSSEVYNTKLENGLEIFVLENHDTPLVRIEIAFRAGASYQTEETEGIFHLYEHMLFKGNTLYESASDIKNALTDMGVSDYNGSTSTEFVNYYFTVPSSEFKNGIKFWAVAAQSPKLDKEELEREKKVVISEISSFIYNKNQIAHTQIYSNLYGKAPYTFSPSGKVEKIQNCSTELLKKMQGDYYCPNNCAIFIMGNIGYEDAVKTVNEYFGEWQKDENCISEKTIEQNRAETTLKENLSFFVQNPTYRSTLMIYFPGPDTLKNKNDTYGADLFSAVCNDRNGKFYKKIKSIKTENGEDAVENFVASYLTTRINGVYAFSFELKNSCENFVEIISEIQNAVSSEIEKMGKSSYYKNSELAKLKNFLGDERVLSEENPNTLMEGIRYYWAICDTDYALSYYDKMNEVKNKELASFAKKYFRSSVTVFYMNSAAYTSQISSFLEAGFSELGAESNWSTEEGKAK